MWGVSVVLYKLFCGVKLKNAPSSKKRFVMIPIMFCIVLSSSIVVAFGTFFNVWFNTLGWYPQMTQISWMSFYMLIEFCVAFVPSVATILMCAPFSNRHEASSRNNTSLVLTNKNLMTSVEVDKRSSVVLANMSRRNMSFQTEEGSSTNEREEERIDELKSEM